MIVIWWPLRHHPMLHSHFQLQTVRHLFAAFYAISTRAHQAFIPELHAVDIDSLHFGTSRINFTTAWLAIRQLTRPLLLAFEASVPDSSTKIASSTNIEQSNKWQQNGILKEVRSSDVIRRRKRLNIVSQDRDHQ